VCGDESRGEASGASNPSWVETCADFSDVSVLIVEPGDILVLMAKDSFHDFAGSRDTLVVRSRPLVGAGF
jgi:hypothetical protein